MAPLTHPPAICLVGLDEEDAVEEVAGEADSVAPIIRWPWALLLLTYRTCPGRLPLCIPCVLVRFLFLLY